MIRPRVPLPVVITYYRSLGWFPVPYSVVAVAMTTNEAYACLSSGTVVGWHVAQNSNPSARNAGTWGW